MKDLKKMLNESLFDIEDNISRMDDITLFGNIFEIKWYSIDRDSRLSEFASVAKVKEVSKSLGYVTNKFHYQALNKTGNYSGVGITRQRNIFMLSMCNILAHVQYNSDHEKFKQNIENMLISHGWTGIDVFVEDQNSKPKLIFHNEIMIVLKKKREKGFTHMIMIKYKRQ